MRPPVVERGHQLELEFNPEIPGRACVPSLFLVGGSRWGKELIYPALAIQSPKLRMVNHGI